MASLSIRSLMPPVLLLAAASFATAADFEPPPAEDAALILGAGAIGANFRVASPVRSDGLMRLYDIETPYGVLHAEGDEMLRLRLAELAAVTALDHLERTSQFADGFRAAAAQPLEFVGDAVADPVGAARDTVSGVGRLFRRAASGVRNAGSGPDDAAASLLGVSAAKRELALELGVDPYTDFPPLADRLERAARASALGGLTVRGALILIPGAVATAASYASAAESVTDLVKSSTPSELRDINRARLASAGVSVAAIDLFLDNRAYTPADQTIFVDAVSALGAVGHLELFVARAAAAGSRDIAIFQRRRAELLSYYSSTVTPLQDVVLVSGIPLTTTRDGRIVAVFPFDLVSWTDITGGLAEVMSAELHGAGVELAITGRATPLAHSQLTLLGWTVTEGLKP